MLSRKIWRINTQPWRDREGGEHLRTELVAPGYCTRVDKGVVERPAVPTPVAGPYTLHNNGHGTLQIIDGQDRMVSHVSFYDATIPKDQLTPEEALWLAQVIVDSLNNASSGSVNIGQTQM